MTRTRSIRPKKALFTDTRIVLENPVQDLFEQFIILNSVAWQTRALAELQSILPPEEYQELETEVFAHRAGMAFGASTKWHDYITPYASKHYFVEQGSGKGKSLTICGAGPSLKDHIKDYDQADQVWGCNSAVTWLANNGHRVTHGFAVDQTSHMYLEWKDAPDDIEYLVSTTIHPSLMELLINRERKYRFFNNFVGMKGDAVRWPDVNGVDTTMRREEWLYALLFPPVVMAGSGLNAVTRALDIAAFMDFDSITVLGADCCMRTKGKPNPAWRLRSPEHTKWLKKNTVFHADGGHALASEATGMVFQATVDGKFWMTKPDMIITAEWLIRMSKASGGKINLVGDGTLPVAFYDKDAEFWARMPGLTDADGSRMAIPF